MRARSAPSASSPCHASCARPPSPPTSQRRAGGRRRSWSFRRRSRHTLSWRAGSVRGARSGGACTCCPSRRSPRRSGAATRTTCASPMSPSPAATRASPSSMAAASSGTTGRSSALSSRCGGPGSSRRGGRSPCRSAARCCPSSWPPRYAASGCRRHSRRPRSPLGPRRTSSAPTAPTRAARSPVLASTTARRRRATDRSRAAGLEPRCAATPLPTVHAPQKIIRLRSSGCARMGAALRCCAPRRPASAWGRAERVSGCKADPQAVRRPAPLRALFGPRPPGSVAATAAARHPYPPFFSRRGAGALRTQRGPAHTSHTVTLLFLFITDGATSPRPSARRGAGLTAKQISDRFAA
mmetsp:Transcript_90045/g.251756  ORF Transcript_90045/g.251756 Transcript_90045/m.251756 type:complete len:354 (-) Transcript_90045:16-1077(-)